MTEAIENNLQKIKFAIEAQIKKKIVYSKDCILLGELILERTKRQISGSTLKRFFGVVKTDFLPSPFTLDTLSLFLGYADWDDFKKLETETTTQTINKNIWFKIKDKYEKVSWYTYHSIQSQIGFQLPMADCRAFAIDRISQFMDSNSFATAFIAPGGYEATKLMTSIYDHLYISENAPYKEDIVLFVNCAILNHLLHNDFSIDHYLIETLGYNLNTNIRNFFFLNPNLRKGRIVLILDNVQDISLNSEKIDWFLRSICNLLANNQKTPWFKLIISCRSFFWSNNNHYFDNPLFKDAWFDVDLTTKDSCYKNIPEYTENELKNLIKLNLNTISFKEVSILKPDLAQLIKLPYFLNLFIHFYPQNKAVNELDLLQYFTDQFIFSSQLSSQKNSLLNAILKASNYAFNIESIKKSSIEKNIHENQLAYKELLMYGVLIESNSIGNHLAFTTNIKFGNPLFFEFLLCNLWLREYELSLELIESILRIYAKNAEIQLCVLKWLLKYTIAENRVDILQNILITFQHLTLGLDYNSFSTQPIPILQLFSNELHQNFETKKELLFHLSSNAITQKLYYEVYVDLDFLMLNLNENLDYYLVSITNENNKTWGLILKLWANILSDNKVISDILAKEISKRKKENGSTQYTDIILKFIQIKYEYYHNRILSRETIQAIFEMENNLNLEDRFNEDIQIPFYYSIIDALDFSESYNPLANFYQIMLTRPKVMRVLKGTDRFTYLQHLYAHALLKKGSINDAYSMYYKLKPSVAPQNSFHSHAIRILFVKYDFMVFDNRLNEAMECAQEIKETARILQFNLYVKRIEDRQKGLKLQLGS